MFVTFPWVRLLLGLLVVGVPSALSSTSVVRAATTWTVCASGCNFTTIALALSNGSVVNGDTLQLTDSTYLENNLNVTKSLTILGTAGSSPKVGKTGDTIFKITTANLIVTIQNMTVQSGTSSIGNQAAGIWSNQGTTKLTLNNVTVISNTKTYGGPTAGIGVGVQSSGPLTVVNSLVARNSAIGGNDGSHGGFSVFGGGIGASGSSLFISNTQILSNSLQGGPTALGWLADGGTVGGGGLSYSATNGRLTIINTVIAQNVITGGNSTDRGGQSGGFAFGGGIAIQDSGTVGIAVLDAVTVSGNRAIGGLGFPAAFPSIGNKGGDSEGGGLFAGGQTVVTITQSSITRNVSTGGDGGSGGSNGSTGGAGGLASGGGASFAGSALISASLVLSNSVLAGAGGAGGSPSAAGVGGAGGIGRGGGLRLGTRTEIRYSAVVSNSVAGGAGGAGGAASGSDGGDGGLGGQGDGGGIQSSSPVTVANSTIALNGALGGTGGIGGNAVSGNLNGGNGGNGGDGQGGGLSVSGPAGAIQSSTVASNTVSSGQGGAGGSKSGFGFNGSPGSNGGADGGGVKSTALAMVVLASVHSNNAALSGPDFSGFVTSQGGNVLSSGFGAAGFAGPNDLIGVNPLLQRVADNGGGTLTAALSPGSPAIGFAGNRACPALDQRGQPRRVGYCDSGAFAVQPNSLQIVNGLGQSTTVGTTFATPLAVRPLYGTAILTGASVAFSGPATGASATFGGQSQTTVTATAGVAQAVATANQIAGSFNALATSGSAPAIAFALTNVARSTTTIVSSTPNPVGLNQPVTVTASVAAVGGTPTGTITVSASTGESCQITAPVGSCILIFATTGERVLTASYGGDSGNLPSTATTNQLVTVAGGGGGGGGGTLVVLPIVVRNAELG